MHYVAFQDQSEDYIGEDDFSDIIQDIVLYFMSLQYILWFQKLQQRNYFGKHKKLYKNYLGFNILV